MVWAFVVGFTLVTLLLYRQWQLHHRYTKIALYRLQTALEKSQDDLREAAKELLVMRAAIKRYGVLTEEQLADVRRQPMEAAANATAAAPQKQAPSETESPPSGDVFATTSDSGDTLH